MAPGCPICTISPTLRSYNNLGIYLQRYMDPSTYQMLSNLKIGSMALFYCLCLRHRLSARQGLALLLLMVAGACYALAVAAGPMPLHITPLGLLLSHPVLPHLRPLVRVHRTAHEATAPSTSEPLPLHFWCAPKSRSACRWRPWPGPPGGFLRMGSACGTEPSSKWTAHVSCHEARQHHTRLLCPAHLWSMPCSQQPCCGCSSQLPSSWPHCSLVWLCTCIMAAASP
uniref:Uncharacterized protein n=1 Tax=Canis lupus familiaris TaxID=9615 RepID=A0A8C0N6U9_CANLF